MAKINSVKKHLYYFSFILLAAFSISNTVYSQNILAADKQKLREKEDSLKLLAENMIVDNSTANRMRSDSQFVRTLVRSLQIKNSFYYPFDSVLGISKLYAPDSSFRIFSWTLSFDVYYSRQRGAIQFKTADGSLRLVSLRDNSEFTANPMDSVRTKDNWIGAVYYNIIKTQHNGKNYYTLFGFDNNSVMSSKKWIEVMYFNEKNEPIFGGPFFSFEEDSVKRPTQYRYSIEYKKDASAFANYDEELKLIIYDYLISETNEPENKWTYIPDGDYEGFKWKNGRWVHVDKVFNQRLEDGNAPVPNPIMDAKGKKDEQKLQEQSNKNKAIKKPGKGND